MTNETKRTMVRYTITTAFLLDLLIVALVLLTGCQSRPEAGRTMQEAPAIFPDYREVTIPVNIAPLNFRIEMPSEKCYAVITTADGSQIEAFGKNKIQWKEKDWTYIKDKNGDNPLTVTVSTFADGEWTTWSPFPIYVNRQPIDSHLAYRLIEPGYEKWHIVGLYQRDLESFTEKTIIRNDMVGYNCINCHSFCGGDPGQMMFHMRAANGGTYIIQNGEIDKLNTKTAGTISNMTYPYWHPSGRYITTSVNNTKQFFHSVKEKKMEVFDLESDVIVYDIEKREILSKASLIGKEAFETFPAFSPDGKWLYFCSAPAAEMPAEYDELRYNLCRVAFDAEKGEISLPIDTLVRADSLSATFPRISPDGRFLMYTETAYGQFPIWHADAEIRMIDLESGAPIDMSALNSPDTDSYHSWSSNNRWVVVSSRRDNGLYTLPYIGYISPEGVSAKPFLLPQKDPDMYDYFLYSYNIPELITGPIEVSPYTIQYVATRENAKQVSFK